MAPPASAASPPLQAGHGGTPASTVTTKAERPSSRGARLQAAARRKSIAWCRARPSPGPQLQEGAMARQDHRGPPQPVPLLTSRQWGRRESPSRPHISLAAARWLQACRSASGPARRRQGPGTAPTPQAASR
ncbi:hypothetical protein NDU88_003141 [Pleurodeles waltl]|uniref:Uncharacterized protein n=1 Tax=Pleurodeles waltl TaxID=8319 RepID=A0AAV7WQQ2_PLEWA|nr:hypothetical protein NDU88_003141 [Pleurodeles waltl]